MARRLAPWQRPGRPISDAKARKSGRNELAKAIAGCGVLVQRPSLPRPALGCKGYSGPARRALVIGHGSGRQLGAAKASPPGRGKGQPRVGRVF